jgi:hypothetical protein
MIGRRETLIAVAAALLLASTGAAQQAASPTKFVTPFKGDADIEMMPAKTTREGNLAVTKFKVKNTSKGPLVGFKVDEYWYNAKGDTVSGSPTFRVMKPFMPGEVIEVTLKSPTTPNAADMTRKMTMFGHQHGKVKPKQVTKFSS